MKILNWLRRAKVSFLKKKRSRHLPLPVHTLPYNQCVKRQRQRFLFSFLLLLLISMFYTIYNAKQRIDNEELVHVWVAKSNLQSPIKIEQTHLQTNYFPKKTLPESFFLSSEDIVGKVLITDVMENEIFLSRHFTERIDTSSISTKFQKSFALTMDESWFEAKFPVLAPHDTIDILTTNPKAGFAQTILIAQNIPIIEIQYEEKSDKKTLVINLTQDEARAVLFARGARLPMHIIVHSSLTPDMNESR